MSIDTYYCPSRHSVLKTLPLFVTTTLKISEHQLQAAVFDFVRIKAQTDKKWETIWANPNGALVPYKTTISKSGKKGVFAPQRTKLIQEGMSAGVPDIVCILPRFRKCGLWLELKVGNNKLSDAQTDKINLLRYYDHAAYCIRTAEPLDILDILSQWVHGQESLFAEAVSKIRIY